MLVSQPEQCWTFVDDTDIDEEFKIPGNDIFNRSVSVVPDTKLMSKKSGCCLDGICLFVMEPKHVEPNSVLNNKIDFYKTLLTLTMHKTTNKFPSYRLYNFSC